MKILYYDCFAGISGDMNLGAMLDLGVDQKFLLEELSKVPVDSYKIKVQKDERGGITGTKDGDTFYLPAGEVHMARSEACTHQAFAYNERVIGLQFHLESTAEGVEALIENCSGELADSSYIQAPSQLKAHPKAFSIINVAMDKLLSRIEKMVKQAS